MALLIAAIASNKLWPLEFFHVAGGAAWTIIDLFLGLVLGPIMGKMSVPARVEFTTKLMPKMVLIMPTVVTATLAAGWQLSTYLGTNLTSNPLHGWVVASMIVVGVMAILALGLLEPANIAVLFELKKPRPNPEVIERLMKRFIYCAGVLGVMQVATLRDHDQAGLRMSERRLPPFTEVGMFSLALIVIGGIYLSSHIPQHVPLGLADRAAHRLGACCWSPTSRSLSRVPGLRLAALLPGGQVGAARLPVHRGPDRVRVPAQPPQGRRAGHPHPLPARLRGPGPRHDRLHRRALRHAGERRGRRLARPRLNSAATRP